LAAAPPRRPPTVPADYAEINATIARRLARHGEKLAAMREQ
jgi:hypothetical protein